MKKAGNKTEKPSRVLFWKKDRKAAEEKKLTDAAQKRLKSTTFKDGLRVITEPLSRDEFDFTGITDTQAKDAVLYEYAREIELCYKEYPYSLLGYPHPLFFTSFHEKWPHAIDLLRLQSGLFPLPIPTIRRDYPSVLLFPRAEPDSLDLPRGFSVGFISERGEYEYARARDYECHDGPLPSDIHYIRVDLRDGREKIKSAFAHWVDEKITKHQGKGWGAIAVNRLHQLAVWRAHRAGMTYEGYLNLRLETFGLEKGRDKNEDCQITRSELIKRKADLLQKEKGGPAYATPRDFEKAWKDAEKELIELKRSCVLIPGS